MFVSVKQSSVSSSKVDNDEKEQVVLEKKVGLLGSIGLVVGVIIGELPKSVRNGLNGTMQHSTRSMCPTKISLLIQSAHVVPAKNTHARAHIHAFRHGHKYIHGGTHAYTHAPKQNELVSELFFVCSIPSYERQAGRYAGGQVGRWAGRQAGRHKYSTAQTTQPQTIHVPVPFDTQKAHIICHLPLIN